MDVGPELLKQGDKPYDKLEFTIIQKYSIKKRLSQEIRGIIINGITFCIFVFESFSMGYKWPSYFPFFSLLSWLAMSKSFGSLAAITIKDEKN